MVLALGVTGKFETCTRPGIQKVGYIRKLGGRKCKGDIKLSFKTYTRYFRVVDKERKKKFLVVFSETLLERVIAVLISLKGALIKNIGKSWFINFIRTHDKSIRFEFS